MKGSSQLLKAAFLGLFLGSLVFQSALLHANDAQDVNEMTIGEITDSLSRTWHDDNPVIQQIFNKAENDSEFNKSLVESLRKRYIAETSTTKITNLIRTFVSINASEMLPHLFKKWDSTKNITFPPEREQIRNELLIAIAKFMPESESVGFLILTESDTTETPMIRLRATILLCATGNKKAIEHVLSVYEKAKKEFPDAMHDKNPALAITSDDSDGDLMPDYIEKGLLLDPNNPDTDGDGLIDGNDRNPLCKTFEGKLSDDQQIAQMMFYLYAKYCSTARSPYKFKLFVVRNIDNYNSTPVRSYFENLTLIGIDGVVIHLKSQDFFEFNDMHGRTVLINNLHKFREEQKDIKKFSLREKGLNSYEMTFKNFDGTWLPIELESRTGFGDAMSR